MDGVGTTKLDFEISARKPNPEAARILGEAGLLKLGNGGTFEIRNSTYTKASDHFIFSFSEGELSELLADMCDPDRSRHAYNACVDIGNAEKLCDILARYGTINKFGTTKHSPLTDYFQIEVGRVNYTLSSRDLAESGLSIPDPLVKHQKYSRQAEVRIILTPLNHVDGDYVTVTIPKEYNPTAEIKGNIFPPEDENEDGNNFESEQQLLDELRATLDFITTKQSNIWDIPVSAINDQNEHALQLKNLQAEFDNDWRLRLSKAWFKLRKIRPSARMDSAIALGYNIAGMKSHLITYLPVTFPLGFLSNSPHDQASSINPTFY